MKHAIDDTIEIIAETFERVLNVFGFDEEEKENFSITPTLCFKVGMPNGDCFYIEDFEPLEEELVKGIEGNYTQEEEEE